MNKEKLLISLILFKYNVPVEEAKIVGTYIEQLENENKAYENMRKEVNIFIKKKQKLGALNYVDINDLLNILNKVGDLHC